MIMMGMRVEPQPGRHAMIPTAEEWVVLATSLGVASRAVLWSLPLAVAFAYALSRPAFPGKSVLDGLAHLPLVLPPVLTGFLLLLIFDAVVRSAPGFEHSFGVHLASLRPRALRSRRRS